MDGPLADEDADKTLSEVEDFECRNAGPGASKNRRIKKDDVQLEFMKWKEARYLLPTEVCFFQL